MRYSSPIFIVIVIYCWNIIEAQVRDDRLKSQSVLYGISSIASASKNASRCNHDLSILLDSINLREIWALKALDASGGPGSGFLFGNNLWIGSHVFCNELQTRKPLTVNYIKIKPPVIKNDTFPPYEMDFVVSYYRYNSSLQTQTARSPIDLITLGLCVPTACDTGDITDLLEDYFETKSLSAQDLFNIDFRLVETKKLTNGLGWFLLLPKTIVAGTVLLVYMGLIACGTLFALRNPKIAKDDNRNNLEMNGTLALKQKCPKNETFGDILRCFDLISHLKSIFTLQRSADSIPFIDGLRLFSMVMIVLSHTILYKLDYVNNYPTLIRIADEFAAQFLANNSYIVDGFFFMGGFLMSYSFYRKRKAKIQNGSIAGSSYWALSQEYCSFALRRIVRLTPAYIGVIVAANLTFTYLNAAYPVQFYERPDINCDKYWWKNLLYINNFYTQSTTCLTWTYYNANDMQFYLLSTFLLLLSLKCFRVSASVVVGAVFLCIGMNAYVLAEINYIAILDELFANFDSIYYLPWLRIAPYMVGIVTGYLVVMKIDADTKLSKKSLVALWTFFPCINLYIMYAIYITSPTLTFSIIYMSVSRTLWAVGLAWLVIACYTNNGGLLNKFLSMNVWTIFSKVTYSVYLLNPLIMSAHSQSSNSSFSLSYGSCVFDSFGLVLESFGIGIICTLLFEYPFINLFKLYDRRNQEKS